MLQIREGKIKKKTNRGKTKKKKRRSVSTTLSGGWMGTKPQRDNNLSGMAQAAWGQVGSGARDRSGKRHSFPFSPKFLLL